VASAEHSKDLDQLRHCLAIGLLGLFPGPILTLLPVSIFALAFAVPSLLLQALILSRSSRRVITDPR
jgi:hypothetical protein